MLQPVRRRTWSPRGKTPIQYSWDRHDRLSVVSAITVSPVRHHLRLFFEIHSRNIRFEEVLAFLKALHAQIGGKFILVLDRYNPHRKAVRLLTQKHSDWIDTEWLPAYAPELNPVEQVWNRTKYVELPNFIPQDVEHLHGEVAKSINRQSGNHLLLCSYFRYTKLRI